MSKKRITLLTNYTLRVRDSSGKPTYPAGKPTGPGSYRDRGFETSLGVRTGAIIN